MKQKENLIWQKYSQTKRAKFGVQSYRYMALLYGVSRAKNGQEEN